MCVLWYTPTIQNIQTFSPFDFFTTQDSVGMLKIAGNCCPDERERERVICLVIFIYYNLSVSSLNYVAWCRCYFLNLLWLLPVSFLSKMPLLPHQTYLLLGKKFSSVYLCTYIELPFVTLWRQGPIATVRPVKEYCWTYLAIVVYYLLT
jgi:hypothetical protein